jgi:hypothetical protein
MSNLNIGIEIRDFDLERMGFSLSVLDDSKNRRLRSLLRMTLPELDVFLKALRAARGEIEVTTYDSTASTSCRPQGLGGREVSPERWRAATSGRPRPPRVGRPRP